MSFELAVQHALQRLGLPDLTPKEEQLQSIRAVYDGKSVFVWLPTGFGKSLCYQALPFVLDFKLGLVGTAKCSAVLVVSPLVSLIVDQVESLRKRKVDCSVITSGSELAKPLVATEKNLHTDSLLFCAPEALMLPRWRAALVNPAVFERVVHWNEYDIFTAGFVEDCFMKYHPCWPILYYGNLIFHVVCMVVDRAKC